MRMNVVCLSGQNIDIEPLAFIGFIGNLKFVNMKTYKNVKSYLKAIRYLADNQEVEQMRGYEKLSPEAQHMLYYLIAGIQNDIGEMEQILNVDKSRSDSEGK